MDIRASHNDLAQPWEILLHDGDESGEITLPAVDTIRLDEMQPPVILIIAPDVAPDGVNVFVRPVEQIPEADRLTILGLLEALADEARNAGVVGQLTAVIHLGGFDYELHGSNVRTLGELDTRQRTIIWALLQAIAQIGQQYPDIPASTVRTLPAA